METPEEEEDLSWVPEGSHSLGTLIEWKLYFTDVGGYRLLEY